MFLIEFVSSILCSGRKRDEMIQGWRRLHNEKLHNLYPSSNVVRMIKARRMRRAEHVVRIGKKKKTANRVLAGCQKEGDY
jgi:hypothetical protein